MLHTLRFSLQNAVYFIMLPFLGSIVEAISMSQAAWLVMVLLATGWKDRVRFGALIFADRLHVHQYSDVMRNQYLSESGRNVNLVTYLHLLPKSKNAQNLLPHPYSLVT
jgi:hypothetical protein